MKNQITRVNETTFEKLHTAEQMQIEAAARAQQNRFIQELRRQFLPRMTFPAFTARQRERAAK